MRRVYIILGIVILVTLAIIVIGNRLVDPTQTVVDIRGTVTNIVTYGDTSTILVEGQKYNDTKYDKASVRVDNHTLISVGVTSRVVSIGRLQVGDVVDVTFRGPVAESYPVQALADVINIIEEVQ